MFATRLGGNHRSKRVVLRPGERPFGSASALPFSRRLISVLVRQCTRSRGCLEQPFASGPRKLAMCHWQTGDEIAFKRLLTTRSRPDNLASEPTDRKTWMIALMAWRLWVRCAPGWLVGRGSRGAISALRRSSSQNPPAEIKTLAATNRQSCRTYLINSLIGLTTSAAAHVLHRLGGLPVMCREQSVQHVYCAWRAHCRLFSSYLP